MVAIALVVVTQRSLHYQPQMHQHTSQTLPCDPYPSDYQLQSRRVLCKWKQRRCHCSLSKSLKPSSDKSRGS